MHSHLPGICIYTDLLWVTMKLKWEWRSQKGRIPGGRWNIQGCIISFRPKRGNLLIAPGSQQRVLYSWVHLSFDRGLSHTWLGFNWAHAAAFTPAFIPAIWARLESEVSHFYLSKHVICSMMYHDACKISCFQSFHTCRIPSDDVQWNVSPAQPCVCVCGVGEGGGGGGCWFT